jgi:hypothetical protein
VPKQILTKKAKEWGLRLVKRIFNHIISWIILGLLLFGAYKYIEVSYLNKELKTTLSLQEGEKRKAVIDFRQKTLTTIFKKENGDERQVVTRLSGLRSAVLTELDDGTVDVYAPTWGLIFETAYSAFISQTKPHIGLDIQWFYWRRLGLSSGGGVRGSTKKGQLVDEEKSLEFGAYPLAFNYNLPFKYTPNTNALIGIDDQLKLMMGVSVKW